jgi:hypothetical protein
MTIPEDVRDIIRTTLEYYVEYWDETIHRWTIDILPMHTRTPK